MPDFLSRNEKSYLLAIPGSLLIIGALYCVRTHLPLPPVIWEGVVFCAALVTASFFINQKAEDRINETLESLASGVMSFDKSGEIFYFNSSAALMIPELAEPDSSEKFIGSYKKFLAFVYDRSLDIQDQSSLAPNLPQINHSRLMFREIVELAHQKIVLIQFYQKGTGKIVAVLTDISVMKTQIENIKAVTEENRIMIKAIEAAGSGMIIANASDPAEPIVFANEIFANAVNRPLDSILNAPFRKFLQESFEENMAVLKPAIDTARLKGSVENIWLKIKRGKDVFWYNFYILFFMDKRDSEFFVCFLSDQTEVHLAQTDAQQKEKLDTIARLAGNTAHDFNNVLSVIDGFSKIIKRGLEKGQDVTPMLESIDRSVLRGSEIIERLLTFGPGRVKNKSVNDICAQIKDFEASMKQAAGDRVNLIVSLQETPCFADTPSGSVTQIISALAANACEAMPAGGDLILSVADATPEQILSFAASKPGQSYISLQVIDNGKGMDDETLSRIYEPFFTTCLSGHRTGIGMSLVNTLVREMDGLIHIDSHPGIGTTVSILIPSKPVPDRILPRDLHKIAKIMQEAPYE